jgi:sec-independent protein translocase protein TatA
MPNLRGSEWLIIILLVVLLFGAKRLPDAARSVGRSLRIFKAETKGLVADPDSDEAPPAATQAAAAPAVTASAPPAVASAAPAVATTQQPVAQPVVQPVAPPVAAPVEPAAPALQPEPGDVGSALQHEPPQQPNQA